MMLGRSGVAPGTAEAVISSNPAKSDVGGRADRARLLPVRGGCLYLACQYSIITRWAFWLLSEGQAYSSGHRAHARLNSPWASCIGWWRRGGLPLDLRAEHNPRH